MGNSEQSESASQAVPPFIVETLAKYGSDIAGVVSERLMEIYKFSPERAATLSELCGSDPVMRVVKAHGAEAADGILAGIDDLSYFPDFNERMERVSKSIEDKDVIECVRRYHGPAAIEVAKEMVESAGSARGNVKKLAKAMASDEVVAALNQLEDSYITGNLISIARNSTDPEVVRTAARTLGKHKKEYAYRLSNIFRDLDYHDRTKDEEALKIAFEIAEEVVDYLPDTRFVDAAYRAARFTKDRGAAKAAAGLMKKMVMFLMRF